MDAAYMERRFVLYHPEQTRVKPSLVPYPQYVEGGYGCSRIETPARVASRGYLAEDPLRLWSRNERIGF
jgi:hypothetical protein